MANELQHRDADTGLNLYFTIRKPNGAAPMWSVAASAWEAMTVANWGNYDITMTESPASSYLYVGSLPAIAGNMTAGWYWLEIYDGAAPAISDDLKGRYFGYWDGTTFRYWASDATHVNGTLQTAGDFLGTWTPTKAGYIDAAITSRGTAMAGEAAAAAAGMALEATLTAMKGAGWSTETLTAIHALAAAIKVVTDKIGSPAMLEQVP